MTAELGRKKTEKYANPMNHMGPAITGHHGKLVHGVLSSSQSSEEEEEDVEHGVRRKKKEIKEKNIAFVDVGHAHEQGDANTDDNGNPHLVSQGSYISSSEHHQENKEILDRFKDHHLATANPN